MKVFLGESFETTFTEVLNKYAPLREKFLRATINRMLRHTTSLHTLPTYVALQKP